MDQLRASTLLCVSAGIALLGSCQFGPDPKTGEPGAAVPQDTLSYVYEEYTQYSKHPVQTAETTDTTFFTASYPVFKDSAVNQFVLNELLGTDTVSVEEAAKMFIAQFDEFSVSDPFPRVWTSESHVKVYQITPSYLGLSTDVFSYTGGAHGNYATVFSHFDLAGRLPLELHDMVADTYLNELTATAERYFRKQENLGTDESLTDRYFFDDGKFSLPDNFAMERDSMLFLYNIYEIKPYVDGTTSLRVPYSEVNQLLTEKAKRIIQEMNM